MTPGQNIIRVKILSDTGPKGGGGGGGGGQKRHMPPRSDHKAYLAPEKS